MLRNRALTQPQQSLTVKALLRYCGAIKALFNELLKLYSSLVKALLRLYYAIAAPLRLYSMSY